MKQLFLLIAFLTWPCYSQETVQNNFLLTVSPNIDKSDKINQAIIETLAEFLKTKNASLSENKSWLQSDFQRYQYPYLDIYNIENSKYGKDYFKPTVMEILKTDNPGNRIIKLAFIGHNEETKENQIKSIYNLVANINEDKVNFSRYLDFATRKWQTVHKGSLTYMVSPNKSIDEKEIIKQQLDIKALCEFFKSSPIPITYFSCTNPQEVFEIKGFDYNPMMYVDKTGGLSDFGNVIFSGNSSEHYTHEIVHIYINNLFPKINRFVDEGIATYIAGSGKFNYEWHRQRLNKFLQKTPNYNFLDHTDPYERLYFEGETSIPYLTAALISERTMRVYGKEKLIGILKSEKELWETLKAVGLTKENINEELRKEIKLPLTDFRGTEIPIRD